MSKNVTIAFGPADHVKVAVEDNKVVVRYNTGLVAYSSDEFTGAESAQSVITADTKPGTTAPVIPQGASEIGQIKALGAFRTDAAGNLITNDGKLITQPEPTDPLPADFGEGTIDDQVRVLLDWQASHSWYGNQIVIDGNKLGQPGREPSVRFTTKDGKLRVEPGTVNPLVAPTVTIPTEPGKGVDVTVAWPTKDGQIRPRSGNLGTAPFVLRTKVPADVQIKPANLGFVHFAEVAGADVTARDTVAYINGEQVYKDFGNTAPGFNFSVGGASKDAQFNLQPGDVMTMDCRTSAGYAGQNSALLCDLAIPSRY